MPGEEEPPAPGPDPVVVLIEGTAGDDRLVGSAADEVLIGGAGNDRLTGGDGADSFVFGAETGDGTRQRDIILDFDATEDLIVLEAGAEIARVVERGDDVTLILTGGEQDRIVLRDADAGVLDAVVPVRAAVVPVPVP